MGKSTLAQDGRGPWLAALWVLLLAACGGSPPVPPKAGVLIHVGQQIVTVDDFQAALAIGRIAYPRQDFVSPALERQLRLRVLSALVEEALIREKARQLGIEVSAEDLRAAEARIRQDYPEDAFEEILLENAVDPIRWRRRLKVRLLLEKTVTEVVGSQVTITPEEIAADVDQGQRLIGQLRRSKIEAAYPRWIGELMREFPVETNQVEWERLAAEAPLQPGGTPKTPGQDGPAVAPRAAEDDNG